MHTFRFMTLTLATAAVVTATALGMGGARKDTPAAKPVAAVTSSLPPALQKSYAASAAKGVAFLLGKQIPDGSWLQHPAVTALACAAIAKSPEGQTPAALAAVNKGLDFVVKHAKPDGSIWNTQAEDYPNYSTSVSLMALALVNRNQDAAVIRAARDFLLTTQFREDVTEDAKAREALSPKDAKVAPVDKQVDKANPAYGGVGYGKEKRPDLSNTQWALEALYLTDHLDREPFSKEPAKAKQADLAWERAMTFLSRCQNLKETNDQVWVADDPQNRGGFVYMPGSSKAGEEDMEGQKALRSYGSMTYAGLKSMIYARVKKDDPRVKAAVEWIMKNYTFEENPGLGAQGFYYYLHTCAKTLAALGQETLMDAAGKPHVWRQELLQAIVARQKPDGSWSNENNRWWESMPELVTAYSLMALEIAGGADFGPVRP